MAQALVVLVNDSLDDESSLQEVRSWRDLTPGTGKGTPANEVSHTCLAQNLP